MPSRTRKKPRTSYHHGDLRRALIDAGLAAIAEEGPEKVSLRDVARRAGVSPAAPYRHFPDKDALIAAVAATCAERLGEVMDAAVASAPEDPIARFRATGIAYVRFAVENQAHFRVMNLPGMASRMPKDTQAAVDEWKGSEYARLVAAQKRGELADVKLEQIMLAANCLVHGLAHLIVDGHEGFCGVGVKEAEELAWIVTEVFGVGLLPRKEQPASPSPSTPSRGSKKKC